MTHTHFQLSPATLAALVSRFGGFFPGPDDPEPSGPSAPVVRRALERFGPQPEPWRWAALYGAVCLASMLLAHAQARGWL